MKKMAAEYGTTPEKRSFLEQKYKEVKLPFNYEGKEAWETMTMYAQTYVLLLAVVIGFLTAGILSLISFSVMGTSGFFTPYQIDDPYSIYILTFGEYYLLILVSGYVATMFCTAVVMLVTAKMHTPNLAVCIPFLNFLYAGLFIILLPFVYRSYRKYGLKK